MQSERLKKLLNSGCYAKGLLVCLMMLDLVSCVNQPKIPAEIDGKSSIFVLMQGQMLANPVIIEPTLRLL